MAPFIKRKRAPEVALAEDMILIRNTSTNQTFPISKAMWKAKQGDWLNKFEEVREKRVPEPPEVTELKQKKRSKKRQPKKSEDQPEVKQEAVVSPEEGDAATQESSDNSGE